MTKTIDIKSMLIGFLLATSVMLFMGATSGNEVGRYQGYGTNAGAFMLDTQTGEIYRYRLKMNGISHWKKESRDENWIVR